MWWRLPRAEFVAGKGTRNQRAFERLVKSGEITGILAYSGREPVGWCAFAPREVYPRLANSRILQPVDDQPVWSVTCFFVAKPFRKRGVSAALLEAAAQYAKKHGARIVEGYPVDSATGRQPDVFVYTGLASAFRKAGFAEVARRSATRPIMRKPVRL